MIIKKMIGTATSNIKIEGTNKFSITQKRNRPPANRLYFLEKGF